MKAFVARGYGGPEVMGLAALPEPEPRTGEVVVDVHAASVNPLDWMLRNGYLRPRTPPDFPRALGADFAGTIRSIGEGVGSLAPGMPVYGATEPLQGGNGAHAERVVVPAARVHRIPMGLSYEQAAALPIAALTVLDGFWRCGPVGGKRVLVNGATGGVGHVAVQVAAARGAVVTAVCPAAHREAALRLGAAEVVDQEAEDFTLGPRRYDVVFDAEGGVDAESAARVIARGGAFVTTLPVERLGLLAPLRRLLGGPRVVVAVPRGRDDDYAVLARLVAAGRLKPVVAGVYPLERAAEAFAAQEFGRAVGKVVIQVGEPDVPWPHLAVAGRRN
ncbi:MAG TPA: NADP-dependent oxidoreductase [Anaeromyxobacteraceae bacterium]|nr:NADP-dependent oxidoreductase [Anaeromyxobacteraceae bacterium]